MQKIDKVGLSQEEEAKIKGMKGKLQEFIFQ